MTEVWTKWEGQVINGAFPLRRCLGGSVHSGVFLTEYPAQNLPNAALKLVPAIPTLMEAQLAYWRTATSLSHPHLIRLFDSGRCQLGELTFLFVVMEYAEQNLAQLLSRRPLTVEEVREMLPPALSALAFLHGRELVQGQLKPSNILVVGDQLKLASDTIRPAGESSASIAQASMYDPPEARDCSASAAGDIWSLGVTTVEALTQHMPAWPDKGAESPSLPTSLPPAFAGIVRRCLNRDPANRASLADLEAWVSPAPQVSARTGAQPEVLPVGAAASSPGLVMSPSEARVLTPRTAASSPKVAMPSPRRGPRNARPSATRRREPAKQRLLVPALALLITLALAVWAGLHLFQRHATPQQPAARPSAASQNPGMPVPAPLEVPAPPAQADSGVARPASVPSPVLHEEIPDVSRSARDTIRGRINVVVRVTVDRSGKVVSAALENPGPSRYFARLALAAAKKWKFAPADQQSSRKWVLRFQFTRGRTTAHATTQRQS